MSEIGDMAFAITLNLNNIVIKKVYGIMRVWTVKIFFYFLKIRNTQTLKIGNTADVSIQS